MSCARSQETKETEREGGRETGNKNKRLMALGTRSICFPVAVAMSLPLVLCNVLTFDTSLAFSDPHRYRRSSPPHTSLLPYLLSRARQGYCSLVRVSNKFVQHISPVCFASFALLLFLPTLLSSLVTFLFDNILHSALRVFRLDILPAAGVIHIRPSRPRRVRVRVRVRVCGSTGR